MLDFNSILAGYTSTRVFKNKKTGKLYIVLGAVQNSTNEQDGQHMIRYARLADYLRNCGEIFQEYVREIHEFSEKFEPVENKDIP